MKKRPEIKAYEDKLGTVKAFVLIEPYIKIWEEFEVSLNLKEGEIPTEDNFNNFVEKHKISIPDLENLGYSLIVFPW